MNRYRGKTIEAVRVAPGNLAAIAEWLTPTGAASGFFWYGDGPARFRNADEELEVAIGDWIVPSGTSHLTLPDRDFQELFQPADEPDL